MNEPTDSTDTTQRRDAVDPLLSIVLPVYNEVRVLSTLAALLAEAARRCGARHELIFVNDGSTDGSQRVLDQLAARRSEIKVVHLSRNFGHQAAIQAGLCSARGDAVVLMDSDLQDSPDAIARFFERWQAGYDVVYAVRTKRKEMWLKRLLFAAFHRLLSRLSATPIPTDAGIFGLIDGRVARQIAELPERDRYLPGLRSWVGFRQTGVEIERQARYDHQPRVSLWRLCRLAKTAIFGFSALPLAAFYVIGLSALAVFLGVGGYALCCKLFTSLAIPGWTSHVLSATFFGAINALGISILGEYVTRIYDQVRQRPLYLVARTVNFDEEPAPVLGMRRAIDDELADLSAGFAAYLVSDVPSEVAESADAQVLELLEEAHALLNATSTCRDRCDTASDDDATSPDAVQKDTAAERHSRAAERHGSEKQPRQATDASEPPTVKLRGRRN